MIASKSILDDLQTFTIRPWTDELKKPEDPKKLYRAVSNSEGDYIYFEGWNIVKKTPCGAQISYYGSPVRFVNLEARKQFASRTRKEALRQLYHRMRKWEEYLYHNLQKAQATQALLKENGYDT